MLGFPSAATHNYSLGEPKPNGYPTPCLYSGVLGHDGRYYGLVDWAQPAALDNGHVKWDVTSQYAVYNFAASLDDLDSIMNTTGVPQHPISKPGSETTSLLPRETAAFTPAATSAVDPKPLKCVRFQ